MPEPRIIPRRISAGVILVDPLGRVLMQLRDDDPAIMYPGHWGLTGGAGIEGETPEQTARREVTEETGLALERIEAFRAYYFSRNGKAAANTKAEGATPAKKPRARAADPAFEVYIFHAPCTTPAEDLVCGEGRELRFFSPIEAVALDIAYNHREVLSDFFASPAYAHYLRGAPFGVPTGDDEGIEPDEHFIHALDAGDPWFDALMAAIALWERPDEVFEGRQYRYLIGGEAFDWLVLAERLVAAAGQRIPGDEAERLLFEARAPADPDALAITPSPERLSDERLRDLIGESKHRAHLNYLYGVTVEEALQYAVELEVSKERGAANIKDPRGDEAAVDPVYERIYGRARADLVREFREAASLPHSQHMSLTEFREFMYWLFKYRVEKQEPARVASDTRKALAHLSAIEAAARRTKRTPRHAPAAPDAEADAVAAGGEM